MQIEDNSGFLVFIVFQYLREFFVFVSASAISMAQNQHLEPPSSQAAQTGMFFKNRIEVLFAIILMSAMKLKKFMQSYFCMFCIMKQ